MATPKDTTPRAGSEKLDTVDRINHVLCLVNAARMAVQADSVPLEIGNPLGTLLDVIWEKLSACADGLEALGSAGA
jgi:hypothetical protein